MTSRAREMGLLAAALGLAAFGLLVGLHRPRPAPRIDPGAAYHLIDWNEPAGQVEELLGPPTGHDCADPEVSPVIVSNPYNKARARHPSWEERVWVFERWEIGILVDDEGKVAATYLRQRTPPRPIWERLWERARSAIRP
jgi:hypothetical protein